MKLDTAASVLVMMLIGVVGKITWDWLSAGRTTKEVFVSVPHCGELRASCCLPQIKKEIGILGSKLQSSEKTLDQYREKFDTTQKDISRIKESVARIEVALNSLLSGNGNGNSNNIGHLK